MSHRLWGNLSPTLGKIGRQFWEIRFRGNLPPNLGKSATDFEKIRHRFCGHPSLTLGKSATDFRETATDFGKLRFWEKHAPLLGQSGSVLVKNWFRFRKTGSVLGKTCSVFWEKTARFRGEIGLVFGLDWIGLGQNSSLTSLGLDFRGLGLGVSKTSQPVASWKGKVLKPIDFDVEPVLC